MAAILDKEDFSRWFGDEADPREYWHPADGSLEVRAAAKGFLLYAEQDQVARVVSTGLARPV
jgi:hypothetical protein